MTSCPSPQVHLQPIWTLCIMPKQSRIDARNLLSRLEEAVYDLSTGLGDVRSRLCNVWISKLHTLRADEFPNELREHWEWIEHEMTRRGPMRNWQGRVWRGSVEHTMRRMQNPTGSQIAKRIVFVRNALREAVCGPTAAKGLWGSMLDEQ